MFAVLCKRADIDYLFTLGFGFPLLDLLFPDYPLTGELADVFFIRVNAKKIHLDLSLDRVDNISFVLSLSLIIVTLLKT